jgi:hypothetical protein
MGSLVLKLAVQYLEGHPEVVMSLIDQAAQAIVHALKAHNAAQATAAK